eukprot:ANDGO_00832.mRNA.1 Lipase
MVWHTWVPYCISARTHVDATMIVFDLAKAFSLLYFAFGAFCPPQSLEAWKCMWCVHNTNVQDVQVFTSDVTQVYGYTAYDKNEDEIIVSFRGSQNIPNWIVDLDFLMISPYEDRRDIKVHAGFWDGLRSVRKQIDAQLDGLFEKYATRKITCTGHSLGAALSTLMAYELARTFNSTVQSGAATFGSPRVGNKEFSDSFDATVLGLSWRHVHHYDIVPHLPPPDAGFHHITQEIWFFNQTAALQYRACSGTDGEDPTCADSVRMQDWIPNDHMTYLGVYNAPCDS